MDLIWGFYLGWGWHPVLFVLLLVISLVLAVKTLPVAWVLPALVLYFGLDWYIPDLWVIPSMLIFHIVFWIAVLVAVFTAFFRSGATSHHRLPFKLMAGLIALLLVLSVLTAGWRLMTGWFDTDEDFPPKPIDVCLTIEGVPDPDIQQELPDGYKADAAKDCTPRREPGKDNATGDEPVACPDRFRQELDPNRQYRFESDGFEGTAREKRKQFVAALGRDYRYLSFVAEQLFDRPVADHTLVTDGRRCLTEKGRTLHAKVEGALMASGVQTGLAPRDGYNTGMRGDEAVVAKRRGVYGDRKATIYTLADGTRLIVLDRCGNMVLGSKPKGTPEGPTDNPPPPKDDNPPDQPPDEGGCVEIPGNGVYDCGGKDPSEEPAEQGNVPDNVTGQNPGTGGSPASQPSAEPPDTYTPPPAPNSGSSGSGSDSGSTPPPEEEAPQPSSPEPSPTQDSCTVNPDWC